MSDIFADTIDLDSSLNGYVVTPEQREAEKEAGPLFGQWQVYNLEDAYRDRPPRQYIVEGLLPRPSLSVVYGGPGSLKSMLLADLCICAAVGIKWLGPVPNTRRPGVTFTTNPVPFLWIDFDNGAARTHERFEAIGKAYDIPAGHGNVHYVSMPTPWLDASKRENVDALVRLIRHYSARLVVIDNLGLITGDTEENSGEMAKVMGNLRWLCEEADAAVIVVHHQRKSSTASTVGIRKGETLRGHSSIEAALDLALLVERKEHSDAVTIIPTKVRGFQEFDLFGGLFAYEHKPGTKEMATARFFAEQTLTIEQAAILKIQNTVKNILIAERSVSQKDIVNAVRDQIAAEPNGKAPGINKVRGILKQMADAGEIGVSGSRGAFVYTRV